MTAKQLDQLHELLELFLELVEADTLTESGKEQVTKDVKAVLEAVEVFSANR